MKEMTKAKVEGLCRAIERKAMYARRDVVDDDITKGQLFKELEMIRQIISEIIYEVENDELVEDM